MPSVSADAEASALSEFIALLTVGDKPVDMTGGGRGRGGGRTGRAVLTPA